MCKISSMTGALCLLLAAAGPARADEKADVQALLDRAIKAGGGEANLKKLQAQVWKFKGKLHDSGLDVSGESSFQAPDRMHSILVFDDGQGQKTKVISVL